MSSDVLFPALPLAEWAGTKETLHRMAQVVGKIRLVASPRRNHWWNVPFHLTGTGITTRPMAAPDGQVFTIDFDFVAHQLRVTTIAGHDAAIPLTSQSVASFYEQTTATLRDLGIGIEPARPTPFDLPDARRPFAEDTEHATYDPAWANRAWYVLSQINLVFEEFAGEFSGKVSPVHLFWHSFDLAVTRFSDRRIDQPASADSVTREAYSREVISAGFWFGDENLDAPSIYSYTVPEPQGLTDEPLRPAAAEWTVSRGGHLAVLRYDDARAAPNPRAAMLDFLHSSYEAGARRAGWDIDALACSGGITDPRR